MTRRGAVQLLAAVAGIVSTAMGQSVARLIGKVTPTQAEYEACKEERSKKVAAMPPGAPWSYIGCEPPQSGPPYVCEIDAEVLTGIRVVSGKETIEVTMAEIMEALRPLPDNVEFACVETSPGKVTFDKCSKILKK